MIHDTREEFKDEKCGHLQRRPVLIFVIFWCKRRMSS